MTSVPLTHDFVPALTALDPYHQYFTSPLSGGMVNSTVRVHISDATEEHECAFGDARSVVAKYAPAFIASLGEGAPFSQYRQVIEARALDLLSQPTISAHIQSSGVTFPKLVHHNPDMNVLVMSDLGEADTLDKWLMSGPDMGVAAEVGRGNGSHYLFEHFDNPSAHMFIFDVAIATVESYLLRCGYDQADAAFVGKLCISMHERQQARMKQLEGGVFGIGDSWPRSFLVGGAAPELKLSVVDWEFAGMIDPLMDLSQLCAHMYLLCQTSPTKIKSRVKACTLAMLRAYHTYAPEWHYKYEYRADAWTLFGQVIITITIDMDWWGEDEIKRRADMKVLGADGARFVKEAKQRGNRDGILFEDLFDVL
ncbi:kinase-like domain-containing protein [Rhizoctonia solani]|nr:kinase-like domain-containing protein [Rhizoctonia solani]